MTAQEVHGFVVGTGRLSATVFVFALLVAGGSRRALALWWTFLGAHTVHFAVVAWFAVANGGRGLFPGGRSLEEAGGWPTVLASAALFYSLALTALAARRAGVASSRWLRIAGSTATTCIGLMFLATYVPLVATSTFFILPAAAITGAMSFHLMRSRWRNPEGLS